MREETNQDRSGWLVYRGGLLGRPQKAMPGEDNRIGKRHPCQQAVNIQNCENGEVLSGSIYNYSTTGLYFEADLPMMPGTQVRLFSEKMRLGRTLKDIRGKVRWCQEIEEAVVLFKYGFGVEFDSPLAGTTQKASLRVIDGGISDAGRSHQKGLKKGKLPKR